MRLFPRTLVLSLAVSLSFGQSASPTNSVERPDAFAKRLYQQVLARPSVGIPFGRNMKVYAPYLSKALLSKMDIAVACEDDWYRQNPEQRNPKRTDLILKPPFASLELGTFTGGDDEGEFHAFHVEKTESKDDGSIRVKLNLIWGTPPEKPWYSEVAVVVRQEDGHYVVDDVIYLKDKARKGGIDWRLTKALSSGCNGSRWSGRLADKP